MAGIWAAGTELLRTHGGDLNNFLEHVRLYRRASVLYVTVAVAEPNESRALVSDMLLFMLPRKAPIPMPVCGVLLEYLLASG